MDNYLQAGELIVDRLKDQLAAVPSANIRHCMSMDWAVENALSPGISIINIDDVVNAGPGGQSQRGKSQASDQIWLVLVSARNVTDAAGAAAAADVGKLVLVVLQALQGWGIPSQLNELYRVRSPFRRTETINSKKVGFVHFPLMFSTKIIVTGAG